MLRFAQHDNREAQHDKRSSFFVGKTLEKIVPLNAKLLILNF
jgi:hypothetical protein